MLHFHQSGRIKIESSPAIVVITLHVNTTYFHKVTLYSYQLKHGQMHEVHKSEDFISLEKRKFEIMWEIHPFKFQHPNFKQQIVVQQRQLI